MAYILQAVELSTISKCACNVLDKNCYHARLYIGCLGFSSFLQKKKKICHCKEAHNFLNVRWSVSVLLSMYWLQSYRYDMF